MKIAVLWWSWFVWYNVSIALLKRFYMLDIYTRSPIQSSIIDQKNVYYFDLNIKSNDIYKRAYDIVIYCIGNSDYNQTQDTTTEFQYFCNNISTKTMIYMSSSSVYMWNYGLLDEKTTWKENAMNSYARNKQYEEDIFTKTNSIRTKIIIRPRAIYGIWDRVLLYNILNKTFFHHIFYLSNIKNHRSSLTHIGTLTDFILYLIDNQKNIESSIHTFNIADQKIYNLYEVFSSINSIFFNKYPIQLSLDYIWYLCSIWLCSKNYYQGLQDIFWWDKILDTTKINSLWFISKHNFDDTLPAIHHRRKEKIWSVSNMRNHRHNLPWMT